MLTTAFARSGVAAPIGAWLPLLTSRMVTVRRDGTHEIRLWSARVR